jgi:hypothetical protein
MPADDGGGPDVDSVDGRTATAIAALQGMVQKHSVAILRTPYGFS